MLSFLPHFGKITNIIFVGIIRKKILLFENGEVIENSAVEANGNDFESPQLKQCFYFETVY